LKFLGLLCQEKLVVDNADLNVTCLQFDDLETFENSKCQPVSVTLAVEEKTRRILGFRVAQMSAKGRLTRKSIKNTDTAETSAGKTGAIFFASLQPIVAHDAVIKSDSNPYYVRDVKEYFPAAQHLRTLGLRGATTGQGELKKAAYDPLFSLNHTCAMFRANVSRWSEKPGRPRKKKERLQDHLAIYAVYHNLHLRN